MTGRAQSSDIVRLPITGMTCAACERRVSSKLLNVPGVTSASVSARAATATITVEGEVPWEGIVSTLEGTGYAVGRPPWLTPDRTTWKATTTAVVVVVLAVAVVAWLGTGDLGSRLGDPGAGGLVAVLVLGLTAGVSTCMALVGGLVLAVSASRVASESSAAGDAATLDRWRPHLAFQAGRVVGFFVLGAGLGAIGARLSLPAPLQAALLVVVAIFMVLLGIRLTGISPRLSGWSLALPGSWTRALGLDERASRPYSDARTALLGAATFFLPCGFTQVVQLYAMTTASPLQSGVVMAVFAVGTAPGLLTLGGLPALASGARRARVLAVVGVGLVVFAGVNVVSAAGLVGWRTPAHAALASGGVTSNVTVSGGIQTVTMAQGSRGYSPDISVVHAGIPIRWVITSESAYTCAAYLRQVDGDWRYDLTTGVNTLDVPALPAGASFDFTCVMGMYSGTLVATDRTTPNPT